MKKLIQTLTCVEKVASVNIYYDDGLDEYKCALKQFGLTMPELDYFTDDAGDALSTAKQMLVDLNKSSKENMQ